MPDLGSTDIQDNAENPLRATVDGNSVEQHSIRDQILAADYEAAKLATAKQKRGLLLTRFRASGAQS